MMEDSEVAKLEERFFELVGMAEQRQAEDELLRSVGRDRLVELAQAEKDGRLVVLPEGTVSMLLAAFANEGDKDIVTPIAEVRGDETHVAALLSFLAYAVAKYNQTDYVSLLTALIENPLDISSANEETEAAEREEA